MKHLRDYGWNESFAAQLATETEPLESVARVIQEHKEAYLVRSAAGTIWAEISGKMRHHGAVRSDFPAVGDWVVLRGLEAYGRRASKSADRPDEAGGQIGAGGPVQICRILPRKSLLSRRIAGRGGDEQVLAANVDIAFLAASVGENFNLRRLERYLTLAREGGARPIVLLTKVDLCADAAPFVQQVRTIGGEEIVAVSVVSGAGVAQVREYLAEGVTAVILGSSGIGKSTLVNHLADADVQDMMETREFDDKGRHCTTFRHLVRTSTGGLIIDTPGLRGLSLGEATDALLTTFADIEQLATTCKFTDCRHDREPGCAIRGALESGALDAGRLDGFLKLQQEVQSMAARENRIANRKQRKLEKRAGAESGKKSKQRWNEENR